MNKTALIAFETVTDIPDGYIELAWDAFTVNLDKERGLWYAYNAQKYFQSPLNVQSLKTDEEKNTWVYKRDTCMHVVAMQYLWNNWFAEAFKIDFFFLGPYYRENVPEIIEQYLEMLMVKRQQAHLQQLFTDVAFKEIFLNHYEVYHSLFISPDYIVTDMRAFVPLVNKINKLAVGYGEPAFIKGT